MGMERSTAGGVARLLAMQLLATVLTPETSGLHGVRVSVPEAVVSGGNAVLLCEYELEAGESLYAVRWYLSEEEFYRYVPGERPPRHLFAGAAVPAVDLAASDMRRLTLRRLHPALHTGEYKCEVTADEPLFHTDIRTAHMTVLEVPEEGPELLPESMKLSAGDELKAKCLGPDTPHQVNLSFFLNGGRVEETWVHHEETAPGQRRATVELAIPTTVDMFQGGRLRLRCLATMWTLYRRTAERHLLEETPPHVAMVINPTTTTGRPQPVYHLYEGDSGTRRQRASLWLALFLLITSSINLATCHQ